ncbi:MAG: pyruvate formate lyase family protein [Succinivibrio sp.]|nr:pyruvate formate lyase family protein [Succinivibrio sp.]
MKKEIKKLLKNSPLYPFLRSTKRTLRIYKEYPQKYGVSPIEALKEIEVCKYDAPYILKKATIKNQGIGDFFYSLDHSIVVEPKNTIIHNMPVDYDYVTNLELGDSVIENSIKAYVKRINDPRVTLEKPHDLKSALQSILLWNSLLWQTGHNLVGLGRLDKVLAKYPIPEDAEELICDFLKTLHCEYTFKSGVLKGDTGQIILLGGLDENGEYFCNEYTKLFIKCIEKIHLPDPKLLLRCSKNMPKELMELSMECNATGIGSPLFSNDDIVIPKLIDFGYEAKDAYNYGVSACWEPLSIGNSLEQNNLANVEYGSCMHQVLVDEKLSDCSTFDDVLNVFYKKLEGNSIQIKTGLDRIVWEDDPLLSLMMGLKSDIAQGGAKYNDYGILSVGMSAAVNSLLNIKKFVFEEHKYTLKDVQKIVLDNYQDSADDFSLFSENANGYGTESDEAISLTNKIISKTETFFKDYRNKFGGKVKFGLSSPGYLMIGQNCGATLDGRKAGEAFQTHISRDKGEPLTEIMNFESKLKFTGTSANANVLDVMVPSSLLKDNVDKFATYMMAGIKSGIFQLQMNVLSYAQLVDAKAHPEKYPNLIVRVWGFSAYFNDLPEEYKDHLINRAKQMEHIN